MSMFRGSSFPGKSVTLSAPAKINLHLEVLGLRSDGFHELAMVMQSIELVDQLEMIRSDSDLISLSSDDSSLSNDDDNLIIQAAKLLRSRAGSSDLGAEIYLRKCIPIGAGLAGGSSDGAAALVGLNLLWDLNFSNEYLVDLASELGSDVPFCVEGGTKFCFGRGERLEPVESSMTNMAVLLVKDPSVSVSTPWAYRRFREINEKKYLKFEDDFQLRRKELREAKWLKPLSVENPPPLRNDLQLIVSEEVVAVQNALAILLDLPGAISVAMSGSGPSCFALFANLDAARSALEFSRKRLQSAGLESWACSMRNEGVKLES